MSINDWRRALFLASRTLGDINAIMRGRIFQRVGNRMMGRALNGLMRNRWF